MTERELSQLYWLNKETEKLQAELRELDSKSLYSSPIITDMPKSKRYDDKIARDIADKIDIARIIELNLERIQIERARLERYISNIKDSETRLIFRLRHINGMTWEDIGEEMGYERTSVSKKHKRYLQQHSHNSH